MKISLEFSTEELQIIQNGLRVAGIRCEDEADSKIYVHHHNQIASHLKNNLNVNPITNLEDL